MAPKEPIRLALRWEFTPRKNRVTGLVTWRWRAYTQGGQLAFESETSFDEFSDCVEDAKRHGYLPPQ
jgi:hypothetical protein